jgi:dynein assembly factor with WDR repeat domains 1
VCLAFAPSGDVLLTGSVDHTLMIWDAWSGAQICTLVGHTGEISAAQFSFDGGLVASASTDCSARVWDATNGSCLAVLKLENASFLCCHLLSRVVDGRYHTKEVLDVAFNSVGKLLCTASADGTANVIAVGSWSVVATLRAHVGEISKVVVGMFVRVVRENGGLTPVGIGCVHHAG